MSGELDAGAVGRRLFALRSLYVPETIDEARDRLARECPRPQQSFEEVAARSLSELRALCELARELHRAPPIALPDDGPEPIGVDLVDRELDRERAQR